MPSNALFYVNDDYNTVGSGSDTGKTAKLETFMCPNCQRIAQVPRVRSGEPDLICKCRYPNTIFTTVRMVPEE